MHLIDHSHTRVLLIGASKFPRDEDIRSIPNVASNLNLLRDCLIDPEIVGIPEENITLLLNENKLVIERHLLQLARETKTKDYTLLIYYSGHGMLSSTEYRLFLTTADTRVDDLEIDGIDIEDFKKYFKRSNAGVKIAILDCCHSGGIFNSMGDMPSAIQAAIKGFEGTYIMTSAAEDEPSLFPADDSQLPTYFTGKLIDTVKKGVEGANEYCSLRDIFNEIDFFCNTHNDPPLPRPQQFNYQNAGELYFSRNRQFKPVVPADEAAWEQAQAKNDKWAYVDFRKSFPDSIYVKEAIRRINLLEEEEEWARAVARNTVSSYYSYIDNHPKGIHVEEALNSIESLRTPVGGRGQQTPVGGVKKPEPEKPKELEDESVWGKAELENTIEAYKKYLETHPDGKYKDEAKERIDTIEARIQRRKVEEDDFWHGCMLRNHPSSYETYLVQYPHGRYVAEANRRITELVSVVEVIEEAPEMPVELLDEPGSSNSLRKGLIAVGCFMGLIIVIYIASHLSGRSSSYQPSTTKTDQPSTAAIDSARMAADSTVGLPAVPAGARVYFEDLKDGQIVRPSFTVLMGATGLKLDAAGFVAAGSGHFNLLVDAGDSIPAGQVVPKDDYHIHFDNAQASVTIDLPPGRHRLTSQFSDGLHRSYGSRLATSINIIVEESKKK